MNPQEYRPQFWETIFPKLSIKSHIIPVSESFIQYLLADGLVLPQSAIVHTLGRDELSDDDNMKEVDSDGPPAPAFLELNVTMDRAISQLGGKVFVKMNAKAPTDAAWINGGSLGCVTAGDVYLLLKASSRVAEHVETDIGMSDHAIVVKKWANLFPSMEFRCFVRNKHLVGISQRNCHDYFPFLLDKAEQSSITTTIWNFFNNKVKDAYPLGSYVMDLYVDKKQRVWILDFDVFAPPTNPLLFSWDELQQSLIDAEADRSHLDSSASVVFRVIEGPTDAFPHPAGSSRGPTDVAQVHNPVALMMKLTQMQQDSTSSDDDDKDTESVNLS